MSYLTIMAQSTGTAQWNKDTLVKFQHISYKKYLKIYQEEKKQVTYKFSEFRMMLTFSTAILETRKQ